MTPEQLTALARHYEIRYYDTWHDAGERTPDALALYWKSRKFQQRADQQREARRIIAQAHNRANDRRKIWDEMRKRPFIIIGKKSYTEIDWTWGYETRMVRRREVTELRLQSSGEPETHHYIRVSYANMSESEARQLYAQQGDSSGEVIFSEWKNVPYAYAKDGMPGAIYQSEGQVQAA